MSAPPRCCQNPELPNDDDLALDLPWARWALDRIRENGLGVSAARLQPDGEWMPCEPDVLLEDGGIASIGQRPGCGGVVTTLHFWDIDGLRGAFWLARAPGAAEDPFVRLVLLQALLRSQGEVVLG